jgi:hypothetical protein
MGLLNKYSGQFHFWALIFCVTIINGTLLFSADNENLYHPPDSWEIPFGIEIGKVENAQLGHHVYIPVTKIQGSEEIRGFDFLIAYDKTALTFMGADPGKLYDIPGNYEWEYFTYRFGYGKDTLYLGSTSLIRFVGMADINNGMHNPKRYTSDDYIVLFTMDFYFAHTNWISFECQPMPIRFYWKDCGDNCIAMSYRGQSWDIKMAISSCVYDHNGKEITNRNSAFPTISGSPNECQSAERMTPNRFINYYNSAIDTGECPDTSDIGDVDLNGYANEIDDVMLFFRCLSEGTSAFLINVDSQIAATDLNGDSIPLTIEDYRWMLNKMYGRPTSNITLYEKIKILRTDTSVIINYGADGRVGFVFLKFRDLFSKAENIKNIKGGWLFRHNHTPWIMSPFYLDTSGTGLLEIIYSESPLELIDYEATGNYGEKVIFEIDDVTPAREFLLHQNHPNPFNSSTAISFELPYQWEWQLEIFNITGQNVRSFSGNDIGFTSVLWDGKDDAGHELSSGIYLYHLKTGEFTESKKMVILK